ncbi:MAG: CAAD domain-containing protein [Nostocaceae cyanobacterium]|nr:CAAD domain-containing protein [Nostocaceae cyanobacterium]
MEKQMGEPEYMETQSSETTVTEINTQSGTITKVSPANDTQQEWQKYGEQVSGFLAELPGYLGTVFNTYKKPLITIGIFLGAIVAVKVVLAVLDALNDIPLLEPLFELIGIAYSTWFVYRYLLKASTRQELFGEIESLKSQTIGKALSDS